MLWTSQAGGDLGSRVLMPVCVMNLEVRAEDIHIRDNGHKWSRKACSLKL